MPPDLVAAVGVGGADGQLLHDVTAALLSAGLDVDEVRPLLAVVTRSDGMSLPAADAWEPLLSAQVHEAAGEYEDALAGYTAAIAAGQRSLGFAPTGTAHVGAARTLVVLGRLDEARVRTRRRPARCSLGGVVGEWTSCDPSSVVWAWART